MARIVVTKNFSIANSLRIPGIIDQEFDVLAVRRCLFHKDLFINVQSHNEGGPLNVCFVSGNEYTLIEGDLHDPEFDFRAPDGEAYPGRFERRLKDAHQTILLFERKHPELIPAASLKRSLLHYDDMRPLSEQWLKDYWRSGKQWAGGADYEYHSFVCHKIPSAAHVFGQWL